MPVHPSRRSLLAAGGVAGLGALLAACGSSSRSGSASADAKSSGSTTTGPWRFTDDRGTTVALPQAPTRVVAYTGTAAALHDFGATDRIVGVFGPTRLADGKADPMAGRLDVGRLTVLGNAWGEFDLEKYAALRPQLLVTDMWLPGQLWYVPDASKDKIAALAPTAGITIAKVQLPEPLARHEQLAGLLGADLRAASVVSAKQRFQQAVETLRRTAKARGGLKVLAASAGADLLYVSDPSVYPDLSYYRSLGVELIAPKQVKGGFFESLSWENADKYGADLILLDSRSSALQAKDLTGKPTWQQLPAVKAGQVVPWLSEVRFSYAGCAPLVEQLAAALDRARKVA
ncbi:ABC transporter substrate-binding protein [Streptacidiphilus jiangxiensis]|uniref:Iron complex transport system substrate-binding protein n=1 Tax=Streptacidiphilus jiangxiensis TaxID=235985 RepID=A0A1H7UPR7_STRJI|nr:ABC transporter substrate-binding protein [Streptacidiphilus jiangxiensis]SEL98759.1 iron complex transport system substrate-binding protein [Streptacidiphilus jiangxiensis]